ncbi:glycosyltransferase family 4 protein [Sphingomonas sp. LB-2]|uniref:glycosyltransferase family 4 protein n=1 Tax=Sphingomonas caeni TaxID=2984949 RepID=UPI002230BF77|nr:glycosyltransferase family 4 protein [Sphingomonas caeni]MCW3849347.1 glycosyltransferase family 4 protein [Sphingomonas caeni]
MRVAIINHGIFPFLMGGMERHTHFLATHMAALGAEVEVVIPALEPDQAAAFAAAGNPYKLTQFPWPQSRLWLRANYLFSKLAAPHLAAGNFDAVYCQGFNGWAYLAGKGPKALTLYNPHGLEMFKTVGLTQTLKSLPMRWAGRKQARLADRTVSLGGGMTQEVRDFLGVPDDKVDVLPNAVDLDYIDSFPAGTRPEPGPARFVFVGRLEHNKGVAYLCEAFAGIEGAHLTIVGSGPLGDDLKARFAGPSIEFAGRLDDAELFARYHASDGFIFASLYEGMPTVILEAMACRLPVIATDIGAVTTMVGKDNGFVVAPGSSEALAQAIRAFLALPTDAREGMGEVSRRRVEARFTWQQVARATLDTIERRLRVRA